MTSEESNDKTKKTALQQWLKKKKSRTATAGISPRPENSDAMLSNGQQRLWFLQQLYSENPFYQYAHTYHFRGKIQVELLEKAFQMMVQRHQILQTVFVEEESGLIQKLNPALEIPFVSVDLKRFASKGQEEEKNRLIKEETNAAFDLENGPLLSVKNFELGDEEHLVLLTMHHIIGDRWSLGILNKEWAHTYQQLSGHSLENLPDLPIQYSDYAHWQKGQTTKEAATTYWQKQLSGELPVLNLPTDHSPSGQPTFRGNLLARTYNTTTSQQLKTLCQELQTTPFVLLLSIYNLLLHQYSGQTDILIGAPFSNRDQTSLEKLIGFFNETLVLRTDFSSDLTFVDLVQQVKQTTLDAIAHKNVPFESLVRTLKVDRGGDTNPLFRAMFLYDTIIPTPSFGADLVLEENMLDIGIAKFDLTLFMVDHIDHLEAVFEFSHDWFTEETIQRMQDHLEYLITQIIDNPQKNIKDYALVTSSEREQILLDWNESKIPFPIEKNIHQFIQDCASKNPNDIAVQCGEEELTYGVLEQKANALADRLLRSGLQKNEAVGIYCDRSIEMVIAIVAVLKSGGAYLPLDPEYPKERLKYMLSDTAAKIVLVQSKLTYDSSGLDLTKIDIALASDPSTKVENYLSVEVNSDNLAYFIFTSGSTGKPKGVPVKHANLIPSTVARFHFYDQHPGRFLLLSSFSFDSSVAGIFWSLCKGGTLVLPPKRIEQDVEALGDIIERFKVSHTLLLPSLYSVLLDHIALEKMTSLNTVMVAGEACSGSLVKKHFDLLPNVGLYNEYGPTEGTVWCTAYKMQPQDASNSIPIGRPIPFMENYILNKNLQPVPIGVVGDLYIGGPAIVDGYWNRSDLNEEKFIPNPFQTKGKAHLYKTGDLAKYRSNGIIDFIGRADQQIKIRGFRVELEEIRAFILKKELIQDALVVVDKRTSGASVKRLVAYIISEEPIDTSALLENLSEQLPAHMVPSFVIPLNEFPRLPNGKIDRKTLPAPASIGTTDSKNYTAASSDLEKQLLEIWESVLGIKEIGIHDNFFEIGGDSILSIQIISKAKKLGLPIAPNLLYEKQTVAALVAAIDREDPSGLKKESYFEPEKVNYPLSYVQEAFLMHHLQKKEDDGVLQLVFNLKGEIDFIRFQQAWQKVVDRRRVMRTAIHWEERMTPEQITTEVATLPWDFYNWMDQFEAEQQNRLEEFKIRDQENPLDLSIAPVSRMALIQLGEKEFILFWTCHHILLDGWSSGIILKEALASYQEMITGQAASLSLVPTYASYLKWQSQQDLSLAKDFWQTRFLNFDYNINIGLAKELSNSNKKSFGNRRFTLDQKFSSQLRTWGRQQQLSLPTLLQGVWGILLARYLKTEDVVFGTTVSGRFIDFDGVDQMTGLLMNVLPTRFQIPKDKSVVDVLKILQEREAKVRPFENNTLDQIRSWIDWPSHQDFFDSLFVYGNFLKDGLTIGPVTVDHFSGGFTSSYPLAIRVNPLDELVFDIRYDQQFFSEETINWFQDQIGHLLQSIGKDSSKIAHDKYASIPLPPEEISKNQQPVKLSSAEEFIAPRNKVELQLSKIWEEILGINPISINDSFFDLGGRSLLVLQLFAKIEQQFQKRLPATSLFEHPTIEGLTKLINSESKNSAWSSLVPLQSSGKKAPLFCFHAGGGHVFFYKEMAQKMDQDRPVYALQPKGIDGRTDFHQSIEAMAKDYLKEMKDIQPVGPYNILGTCFSNAISLEVANQLAAIGEGVDQFFIIDSGPAHLVPISPNGEKKTMRRFASMIKKGDVKGIAKKFRSRWIRLKNKYQMESLSEEEKNLRSLIQSMNDTYRKYTWKPFIGKITFIRSTEFANRKDKNFHLIQWKRLAEGGLDVHLVDGHHLTLFEEPEVTGLVKQLESCLEEK